MSADPFNTARALADCLCAQIEKDENYPVCFCGLIPGDAATDDYYGTCKNKNGMAWVRMAALYPSDTTGAAKVTTENCGSLLGMDLEIGMMRSMPVLDDRGNPPSPQSLLDAAKQQINDAMTMWRAVNCCPALDPTATILGTYQPIGPQGGSGGGAYLISLTVEEESSELY